MSSEQEIHDQLKRLLHNAYAPYSQFRVAAAAVDDDGRVHLGVNVENQSFPVGLCAEAAAISALIAAGGRSVKKLYLLSEPNIEVVPCGACRQRLAEFGSADTQVTTFGKDGGQTEFSLGQLFPHGFRFK
jgi:cytidine deaminase